MYWHACLGKHAGLGHGGAGASPAKINTRGLTFLDRWTDEAHLFERADSLRGRRVGRAPPALLAAPGRPMATARSPILKQQHSSSFWSTLAGPRHPLARTKRRLTLTDFCSRRRCTSGEQHCTAVCFSCLALPLADE